MFGFGSSRKSSRDNDIFDIVDVQELAQAFPQKISLSENSRIDPNELILLVSGEGFIVRSAVSQALGNELGKKSGRLPIVTLATSLGIAPKELLRILHDDKTTFLSKDGSSVLTRLELKTIVEKLRSKAEELFVPATVFADESDMDCKDLIRLVEISDTMVEEGTLQLFQDSGVSSPSSKHVPYLYIHTLSLLLKTKKSLAEKMTIAQEEAKPTFWTFSEMSGLSKSAFCRLAESLFPPTEEINAVQGDFEDVEDGVRFIPHAYVLRKVKHHAIEVARGDKPYCDLKNLSRLYPRLLSDVSSAQEIVVNAAHEKDGAPASFHIISHYAIGDSFLNSSARTNLEKLGYDRCTTTKPYLKAFPKEVHDEIRVLLHNRTILYFRENGADRRDILTLGDWLVLVALIADLSSAATRLGRITAEEQWQIQSENSTHIPTLSAPNFLERLQKESETPLELLQHLWELRGNESISFAATTAFEKHIAEMQKDTHDQFAYLWISRLGLKSSIYTAGLEALPAGPLKDQLSELLSTHLLQDLIPSAIKRARTKGLIRTPNLIKQIGKLENEMAAIKDARKSSPQDSLSKFAKKISLEIPSSDQLATAKKEHLDDMVATMSKDKDGPRLFLSLVLVLCASKREGVVYATGKFAPKLLKVSREELDEDLYKRVEEIKELVKLGKVDKAVRVEMRELAARAVKDVVGEDGDSGSKNENGKAGEE